MEKGKKENKFYILVIVVFIISLIFFMYSWYMNSKIVLEREEIDAIIEVTSIAGFAVTNESLVFGRLPPGTSSYKDIIITNDYDFPIRVEFKAKGDISDFLVYYDIVYLDIGEEKIIPIETVKIPKGTPYGNYTGKMVITFKRDAR